MKLNFFVLLLLAACAQQAEKEEVESIEKAKPDQIVLIFQDPPSSNKRFDRNIAVLSS